MARIALRKGRLTDVQAVCRSAQRNSVVEEVPENGIVLRTSMKSTRAA